MLLFSPSALPTQGQLGHNCGHWTIGRFSHPRKRPRLCFCTMKNLLYFLTTTTCAGVLSLGLSTHVYGAEAPEQSTAASGETLENFRPLDRIVAVVNRDVITEFELQARVHQVALNLRRQQIGLPPMAQLRRQVLERLILEKAIEQRAQETGLRVDEQMVNASIEQIARNNGLTLEQLRERLRDDGTAYGSFREQIRQEILLQRLRTREVDSKIIIPESEIDAYLAEKAGFSSDETMEYRLSHILIPVPSDTDGAAKAKLLANDVLDRAKRGEDFGKLAAEYSKSGDALQGGDLDWKDPTRLPSVFWQAIQANPKKGTVVMTKTADAFHIIKVLDERDGVKAKLAGAPVVQTHVRQILMFVSDIMPEADVLARLGEIRQHILAKDGDFATYARLNSVDNSATRGGDLGWVHPGDLMPEFEDVMNRLKPGEISEPFRTKYGYHLIEVVDRRKQVADAERSRFSARQALRERKLAEAFAEWQRELRDRAYVEIREENL